MHPTFKKAAFEQASWRTRELPALQDEAQLARVPGPKVHLQWQAGSTGRGSAGGGSLSRCSRMQQLLPPNPARLPLHQPVSVTLLRRCGKHSPMAR